MKKKVPSKENSHKDPPEFSSCLNINMKYVELEQRLFL